MKVHFTNQLQGSFVTIVSLPKKLYLKFARQRSMVYRQGYHFCLERGPLLFLTPSRGLTLPKLLNICVLETRPILLWNKIDYPVVNSYQKCPVFCQEVDRLFTTHHPLLLLIFIDGFAMFTAENLSILPGAWKN